MWEDGRDEYFAHFFAAACSAARPGLAEIDKQQSASVYYVYYRHHHHHL